MYVFAAEIVDDGHILTNLLLKVDFVMVGVEDDYHDLEDLAQAGRMAHHHVWVGQGVWYAARSLGAHHRVMEWDVTTCQGREKQHVDPVLISIFGLKLH